MLYPRYTQLIINYVFGIYLEVLKRFLELPKRFLEPYQFAYNDDHVAKMFATGDKVLKVVGLPVELLTEDIKRTAAYQDYMDEYKRLDSLMIQPSLVASTNGLIGYLAPLDYEQHQDNTTRDLVVVNIDDEILTEQVAYMDEGEDIEADLFADTMMLSQPIPSPRNEKKQKSIPTPPRSIRSDLSLDKAKFVQLTDTQDTSSEVLRKSYLKGIMKKINDAVYVAIPRISINATNDQLKDNLPKIIS
nr:hypothetical protein [Tanacetum cinerariifolium]